MVATFRIPCATKRQRISTQGETDIKYRKMRRKGRDEEEEISPGANSLRVHIVSENPFTISFIHPPAMQPFIPSLDLLPGSPCNQAIFDGHVSSVLRLI
ncbi:hypothetical protein ElyMa_003789800 [Elysia marginata]|uniref:Uncharacterized protein n=1 Tax=Elysia marginata TaxID=1093978 RepID=A0AAV4FB33_9GAST|nr:hypothetical protein ElyMa_003789800 [Elysia marginata]